MTDIPGDAADELRELQEQFALRLPARLSEIDEAWQAALGSGWDGVRLHQFLRLSHSLSGAAATFGFPAVAAVAARLEALLQRVLQQMTAAGGPPDEEAARRIASLMDELRSHDPAQDGRGNR